MDTGLLIALGLVMLVGVFGAATQLFPGNLLILLAFGVWAYELGTTTGWVLFGIAAAITAASYVLKYVIPAKRMKGEGVPFRTMLVGFVVGVIGFFVLPVIGLPIGFVLGVYLMELWRAKEQDRAVYATKVAVKGVLISIAIELAAAALAVGLWVLGLFIA